ncbi:MAG TPA: aminomethyl-transferring glycine dehydrogenase subunit GcvPA [Polyangiaceae bacterium]|nr:aminomethyl-transferring glycine dehydrogenase subunit GcvPA [Polyangiaceae bacterium]
MRYLPHTDAEIAEMLSVVGRASLDQLFDSVPESVRFRGDLKVPPALSEPALMTHLQNLAQANTGAQLLSFLGAGAYDHHIPPAVDQLLLRGEFYTAYTPYQPEVAQGTLQAIWEFQTMVSELYGLPLANASVYDGGSAAAEGAQMARRLTRREKIIVCHSVHPQYRDVVKTYLGPNAEYVEVPVSANGTTDLAALEKHLNDQAAAVLVGYPSFYGPYSDVRAVVSKAHDVGALVVACNSEPYALALAEAPGALGCDIAVGEGQPLACPPQFGGPGVGLFACRNDRNYLQQLPGRLCGETVDNKGQRGYVLTLSTREQHIRRERATSNICTNQGLLALSFAIRVSLLGKRGFVEVATACHAKANYLRNQVATLKGYSLAYTGQPYFNEFAIRVRGGNAAKVCQALEAQGIIAGLDLGRIDPKQPDCLLIAVTEKHERESLDKFVKALDQVAA